MTLQSVTARLSHLCAVGLLVAAAGYFSVTPAHAVAPSAIKQDSYRWRNDDGSEAAASWKQNADTAHAGQTRGENIRVRVCIVNLSGSVSEDSPATTYRLEYATSTAGPWTTVPTGGTSGRFVMSSTPYYANQSETTDQLGPTTSGTFDFANRGKAVEAPDNAASPGFSVPGDRYVNMEYCFQARSDAPAGPYYFRSVLKGAANSFDVVYDVYPQLTLEAGTVPAITSAVSVAAEANVDFSYDIGASGAKPMAYNATSLPAWLIFDGTRTLSGIPPAIGTYTATISAQNGFGSDSGTLTINVSAAAGVVVDDADANTTRSGTWTSSGAANAWDGGSLFGTQSPSQENAYAVFRWTPNLPQAGDYEVYAWWTYHERRDEKVPYRVTHNGGTDTVVVDQNNASLAGKWNLLGTYAFAAGQTGYVTVSAENGQACADAVRFKYLANPLDADADGLLDSWEVTHFGAIDAPAAQPLADPDGDTMVNINEQKAGTVPTDETSVLVIESAEVAAGTLPLLRWQSVAGKTYNVERSTNLASPEAWSSVANGINATPPQNTYTGGVAILTSFYRVVLAP